MREQCSLPLEPGTEHTTDAAERAEYLDRLREQLKTPAFRAIEGLSHKMRGHDARDTRLTLGG